MLVKFIKCISLVLVCAYIAACGGGGGGGAPASAEVVDPYESWPYKSEADLPEGIYFLYHYPYTKINSLTVRQKNCNVSHLRDEQGDCNLFTGNIELLDDVNKYFVSNSSFTYYRLNDLTFNNALEMDIEFDATFESYNYKLKKSKIKNRFERFQVALPSDKRVWVLEAKNAPRQFKVKNHLSYRFQYALVRFTDTFYINNFEMWDSNEKNITNRLKAYFEPLDVYYTPRAWSTFYQTDFEVLATDIVEPHGTHYVDAIPPGLTCVVPMLDGYLNAPLGWAGCQYNLDSPENIDAQNFRYVDLDLTILMVNPY